MVRTEVVTKRKREDGEEDDDDPPEPSRFHMDAIGSSGGGSSSMLGRAHLQGGDAFKKTVSKQSIPAPPIGNAKKRGAQNSRTAGRFQNQQLVKLINSNVGLEVSQRALSSKQSN